MQRVLRQLAFAYRAFVLPAVYLSHSHRQKEISRVQWVSEDASEVHKSKRAMLRTSAIVAAASPLGIGAQVRAAPPKAATSSTPGKFWPDGVRLVISVSMPFEAGAQNEHNNGSPFPAMDAKYPDLPART